MKIQTFALVLLASAFCLRASARSYSINWYKVAGGGGTSIGATYQVTGTIGQPDASAAMSGGQYSVTGGFWSLISVVQMPGLPNLTITHSGNSVTVSWPDTGSYTLQQNSNLAATRQLGDERLFHQHGQRHEQHHHHLADRESVLPLV
jgi:hypothetical protein